MIIRRILLFGLFISLSVLGGCVSWFRPIQDALIVDQMPQVEPVDAERIAEGVDVYLSSYCGVCHQLEAAGTQGIFGTPHNEMGLLAAQRIQDETYTGEATTPAQYIRESLLNPRAYIAPEYRASAHQMPPFTHLSDEQIDALVYLLVHQP